MNVNKMAYVTTACLFAALITMLTVDCQLSSQDICEFCTCLPRREVAVTVDCRCDQNRNSLTFSSGQMGLLRRTKSFTVSGCFEVDFEQNSFHSLSELQTLKIEHNRKVTLRTGVFDTLTSLVIQDVGYLELTKRAFMGARDVKNITMKDVNIPVLPTHALYDIKGLIYFELNNVSITEVKNDAINVTMEPSSTFIINDCTLEKVAPYAITVTSDTAIVNHTAFRSLPTDGIALNTETTAIITNCEFSQKMNDSSVVLLGKSILISKNMFSVPLTGREFYGMHVKSHTGYDGSFSFTDNLIIYTDFVTTLSYLANITTSPTTLYNNEFICDCIYDPNVLSNRIVQRLEHFQDNRCRYPCDVTLLEFALRYENICEVNTANIRTLSIAELCENIEQSQTTTPTAKTPIREGKNISLLYTTMPQSDISPTMLVSGSFQEFLAQNNAASVVYKTYNSVAISISGLITFFLYLH